MDTSLPSLRYALCLVLAVLLIGCTETNQDLDTKQHPELPKKPNIVMIFSDDHGIEDAGAYGNSFISTPNIDLLATEGMTLSRMYTVSAMCTPSRSAMYTGLYPHNNGAYQNHSAISEGVKTLPHYLNDLGYKSALLGKKHIKPIDQFPFLFLNADSLDEFLKSQEPYVLLITPDEPHAPASMTFAPSDQYALHKIPIPPYLVDTQETRQQRTGYYDLIDTLDKRVGEIIEKLKSIGEFDNTVFIYASDHGAGFPFEKWTCYEAGVKVPFIVRWPAVIEAGSSSDAMISLIDVLPTFIEMAGGTAPDSLDGRSFLHVLTGTQHSHRQLIFTTHTTTGIIEGSYYPIRSVRNDRYKYIRNMNPDGMFTNLITNRTGQGGWDSWVALAGTDAHANERVVKYQSRPPEELYDLQQDPYEMTNRINDPSLTEIKQELSATLDTWMKSVNDDVLEN